MAHRLALVTVAATFVLILFGGLVTNTGAALAVPDWPSTFGHNMFLFPWSGMIGGVFYEHSHRLIGAVVGLLTLALAAALWPRGGRLRALGLVAVAAVIVQGVLGGLRVVCSRPARHRARLTWPRPSGRRGGLAVLTGRAASAAPVPSAAPRGLALAAVVVVYEQIVFGALLTHEGWLCSTSPARWRSSRWCRPHRARATARRRARRACGTVRCSCCSACSLRSVPAASSRAFPPCGFRRAADDACAAGGAPARGQPDPGRRRRRCHPRGRGRSPARTAGVPLAAHAGMGGAR